MSIHEIKHQSGHGYIHLPGCNKSPAWRIRRFLRQIRAEIKALVRPTKCVCRTRRAQSAERKAKEQNAMRHAPGAKLFNERGFPTKEWFDRIKVD